MHFTNLFHFFYSVYSIFFYFALIYLHSYKNSSSRPVGFLIFAWITHAANIQEQNSGFIKVYYAPQVPLQYVGIGHSKKYVHAIFISHVTCVRGGNKSNSSRSLDKALVVDASTTSAVSQCCTVLKGSGRICTVRRLMMRSRPKGGVRHGYCRLSPSRSKWKKNKRVCRAYWKY